ncbi:MAG: hypothetical protein LUF33_03700, partial [Clostridiales bacterium]|nr:hypothetical protein [Clostridiales bacterium]
TQLDDKAYFELIYELAKTLGGANGEILLNQKDLSRLPDDFTQRLSESGVTAAVNKSAVDISGGFILKSGDIEENMSFESVIADKRDLLEDLINRELFVE